MSKHIANPISKSIVPRHGHIFSPASRAYFAWQAGDLDEGALNQRESGKFFPAVAGGLLDVYAPEDVANSPPPPDGKIASANQATGLFLDQPGSHWQKHEVRGGEMLDISWHFTANHVTRRWNYFITKEAWDPSQVLSRDQFEAEPFYTVQINLKPYWSHGDAMKPPSPTVHQMPLPIREGYHVLLAIWEVADTAAAFYQVVDLDFVEREGGGGRPTTPTGLKASDITDKQVRLTWNASTGSSTIASYRITRDGSTTVDVYVPLLSWTDNSVLPGTSYSYFVTAIDDRGNQSLPSTAIQVRTQAEGGGTASPTAPVNLHSMNTTANTVSLMWGASTGGYPLKHYNFYRDGEQVTTIPASQTSFTDSGLTPATMYRFFVAAEDTQGQLSVPSNVLSVTTSTGEGGETPEWKLGESYKVGDKVIYQGVKYACFQAHISNAGWTPAETVNILWLLV
ncbi:lytic polysaccharide monooxygenase [Pseudomonas sp. B329]|uniref:lytic polysaccharide monooxygenase n=1 Tax=Pseudomonas sp. B329 TaxID=1553459 RepID=UPI002005060B|nr:lytic polysaccharide monooxygenase [Pseudomonas sp. B329]MCK3861519.1 chitin-binding protein [Pseudomonas sp. B329]